MMRVLALGGCGQEGKPAVIDLCQQADVQEIIIGDINIDAARKFAATLGGKGRALSIDVRDRRALLAAMEDCDLVASFVGPYYAFGCMVLEAAIQAKRDFVDICDDPLPTLAELDLDSDAKQAGVSAIVGMGASPGIFNIFGAYGASFLDQVEDIDTSWVVPVTEVEDTGSSAAIYHLLNIIDGNCTQFIDGELRQVPAMSGQRVTTYPKVGEVTEYFVGHPEPVTLPRYFPGLRNATNRGCMPGLDDWLRSLRHVGLTAGGEIQGAKGPINIREVAMALVNAAPMPPPELLPPAITGGRIVVRGQKDGAHVEREYVLNHPLKMGPNTGVAASIGVLMLGRGQITKKGVYAPEGCVDPTLFLKEQLARGWIWEEIVTVRKTLSV